MSGLSGGSLRAADVTELCSLKASAIPTRTLVARVGEHNPLASRNSGVGKLPRLLCARDAHVGRPYGSAEDVAQEAFVWIGNRRPTGQKEGEARFDTRIDRVALNLCYDRLRGRRGGASFADLPDQADPQALPDMQIEARVRDERVRTALAALPVRQREALVLHA